MKQTLTLGFTCLLVSTASYALPEDIQTNSSIQLKNLYSDRDFNQGQSIGSWSQGVIYQDEIKKNFDQFSISVLPNLQYAYLLSSPKPLSDNIFKYDDIQLEQARDYAKLAVGLRFSNENHTLTLGDLKLNHPITAADPTRQLTPMYQGVQYIFKDKAFGELELGYVNKYSARSEDKLTDLAISKQKSDGVYYVNYQQKQHPHWAYDVYLGDLQDLFYQFHLGVDYKNELLGFPNHLKLKYFNINDSGQSLLGDVQTSYYGVMNTLDMKPFELGLGYQVIDGNSNFYLLDQAIPGTHFIHWTQGAFNKQDEKSYHVNAKLELDRYVSGLSLNYRYIYGDNFKTAGQLNTEIERDYIINYNAQEWLKGLNFQIIYVNYDIAYGRSYDEVRALTTYSLKF